MGLYKRKKIENTENDLLNFIMEYYLILIVAKSKLSKDLNYESIKTKLDWNSLYHLKSIEIIG